MKQALAPKYILEDQTPIGQGSFAKVLKAKERDTGKLVAVKVYQKQRMDEQEEISLERQVHIMKNVNHPNIVNFQDYKFDKKHIYLILEYLQGGQLYERIIESENFTEKEAKDIISPIIDAIRYLHESGIVHRDLKPQNLVYSSKGPNGILKIIDFGVSQIISPETHLMSTATGTPQYMAPEILKGQKYTNAVDWWSLGVILYVLLCGYPPFYCQNPLELTMLIRKGQVQYQEEDWDLVQKLLNPNPAQRIKIGEIENHPWMAKEAPKQKLQTPQKLKLYLLKFKKAVNVIKAVNRLKGQFNFQNQQEQQKININQKKYQFYKRQQEK